MSHARSLQRILIAFAMGLAGLLCWPAESHAQTVSGYATVVQGSVLGTSGSFADTGPLADSSDAREASLDTLSLPSLLSGEALHAAAIGWPDQAYSEASLGSLAMTVAGNGIAADFIMARALAVLGSPGTGTSGIDGLSINGAPVAVSGAPNQVIPILGGRVILNEQQASASGIVVNAVHVIVDGIADVVVASATAGISSGGSTSPLPLPIPPLL